MEVLTYDGTRMWVGPTDDEEFARIVGEGGRRAEIYRGMREIAHRYGDDIRSRYPEIPRRVSGYNLDSVLPENGFHIARLLVGSESTLVTVLQAELQLVRRPAADALVLLGFDDIASAADAAPAISEHQPVALEGLDHRLIELEHSQHMAEKALRQLPEGNAWLMVQFTGEDQDDADRKANAMVDDLRHRATPHAVIIDDPGRKKQVWAAREAGLGATAFPPNEPETHEGWEDAAVPPAQLGKYLRAISGTCSTSTDMELPRFTAISGRAVCTPGSRSICAPPKASRSTAGSRRRAPTSSSSTAARCRVSTATANLVGSCCRSCSAIVWSRRWKK
jgi:hypothetical protein